MQATAKRERSPSYPAIDLQSAIARARVLYDKERRSAAPVDAVLAHWGYRPKTGPGLRILSALKQFGLLNDVASGASRRVRLTDLAYKIIVDDRPESPERDGAIRECALNPRIHQQLWDKHEGRLPSDQTLRYELRTERGFTESAATEIVKKFRSTIDFARLSEADTMAETAEANGWSAEDRPTVMDATPGRGRGQPLSGRPAVGTVVNLPLSSSKWATLTAPFPLSEAEWRLMAQVLAAMKPALVEDWDSSEDDGDPLLDEANPQ